MMSLSLPFETHTTPYSREGERAVGASFLAPSQVEASTKKNRNQSKAEPTRNSQWRPSGDPPLEIRRVSRRSSASSASATSCSAVLTSGFSRALARATVNRPREAPDRKLPFDARLRRTPALAIGPHLRGSDTVVSRGLSRYVRSVPHVPFYSTEPSGLRAARPTLCRNSLARVRSVPFPLSTTPYLPTYCITCELLCTRVQCV